jgi:hypothetical protein
MLINFQLIYTRDKTLGELAAGYSKADLVMALNGYVDYTCQIIGGVDNEQVNYVPHDPDANDAYAASESERHAGWSLAHLVMHVTASAEEAAAFSSILARGIALGGRLRSDRDWRQVTTCAQVVSRLEECRRICLAYLGAWPDQPDMATLRILPEHMPWSPPNAPTQFLVGLLHWHAHIEQFAKVAEQARSLAATANSA